MTTNRNEVERTGDAVNNAYRPFALTGAQRREHRERLTAVAGRRGAIRLRAHLTEVAAIAAVALIAVSGFLYWNSLDPGSDDDEAVLGDATATDVKCFSDLDLSFSRPPEVQDQIATQLTADGYVDCSTPEATPTPCVPLPDALQGNVPVAGTQPISDDTVYCPPEPTPTFTPAPTPPFAPSPTPPPPLPTSEFAGKYGFYYGACRATPYTDEYPPNPLRPGFTDTWFGGESFGLWAGLDREMEGSWSTSNTVLWAAHDGPFAEEQGMLSIEIEGWRMDGDAPPLETEVLPVSDPPLDGDVPASERGAQALTEMRFPEPGCWQVVGSAGGDLLLSFVFEVVPEEESAQALHTRQRKEAIDAEREAAMPFPVPDTCSVDTWIGPENRLLGQYPAEMVEDDDWTYSYFLDGSGMSLNARLGLFYEGTNTVFWVSVEGRPPGDDIYKAELLDGESAGEEITIERARSTYSVELASGVELNVEPTEIDFPSTGCWELRIESEEVDFSQTVYVYPPAEDRAEVARKHERLYTKDLDGRVNGFDLETGARFLSIWIGSYADVALSPDGQTLYTAGYDDEGGTLAAYDAISGEELWTVSREYPKTGYLGDGGPPTIIVSPDGGRLYVYESDNQDGQVHRMVAAYDAGSGQPVARAPIPFRTSQENAVLYSCAASIWPATSDDQVLAICKGGGSYNLLDMASGDFIESMAGVPVSGMTVETAGSVNGKLVYVVTDQGDVAVYDRESMELIEVVELIDDAQPAWSGAALSPDGSRLYVALRSVDTGAYFREVRVFDTATWEEVDRFELPFDGFGRSMAVDSAGNVYGIEWLSTTRTQVWKRDSATGEITVMLVADAEVHQLLVAGSREGRD